MSEIYYANTVLMRGLAHGLEQLYITQSSSYSSQISLMGRAQLSYCP